MLGHELDECRYALDKVFYAYLVLLHHQDLRKDEHLGIEKSVPIFVMYRQFR